MLPTEDLFETSQIFGIKITFKNLRKINPDHLGKADTKRKEIPLTPP